MNLQTLLSAVQSTSSKVSSAAAVAAVAAATNSNTKEDGGIKQVTKPSQAEAAAAADAGEHGQSSSQNTQMVLCSPKPVKPILNSPRLFEDLRTTITPSPPIQAVVTPSAAMLKSVHLAKSVETRLMERYEQQQRRRDLVRSTYMQLMAESQPYPPALMFAVIKRYI